MIVSYLLFVAGVEFLVLFYLVHWAYLNGALIVHDPNRAVLIIEMFLTMSLSILSFYYGVKSIPKKVKPIIIPQNPKGDEK